jgi:glycosyltransferase involved in cell wall biosynthesis
LKSIIVPTRNRPNLLKDLLESLNGIDNDFEIIVVDSSDTPIQDEFKPLNCSLIYIHTNIKSAAIQRNIGLDNLSPKSEFVFFLDDDVRIPTNYFEDLIQLLREFKAVGASGIAVNLNKNIIRAKPSNLIGFLHRMFLLDSMDDGKLLKSGVNIPCRKGSVENVESEWLIACSVWKTDFIKETRFEKDFMGASLAEDVIFSVKMRKKGKLVTTTKILLNHFEDPNGRPNSREFWKMWVINRLRVIRSANFGIIGYLAYSWANLGQTLVFILGLLRRKPGSTLSLMGIIDGYKHILWRNN